MRAIDQGPAGEVSMLIDSSNPAAGSGLTGAIHQASRATGASFNFLLATAQVESGLDPQTGASARGLFHEAGS
jgi:hypothetical protein